MERVFNFNAGPSAMPLDVLQRVQQEFLDFDGTGMSIVEISHRSAAYQRMQDETVALLQSSCRFLKAIMSSSCKVAVACNSSCTVQISCTIAVAI